MFIIAGLLTPWCRVLPEQLTGLQLVKKFPAFHGTRRFITALTSVRHHNCWLTINISYTMYSYVYSVFITIPHYIGSSVIANRLKDIESVCMVVEPREMVFPWFRTLLLQQLIQSGRRRCEIKKCIHCNTQCIYSKLNHYNVELGSYSS